ncbi:MAG: ABC transporter permease [Piscirickettsiaceae bacterium CG18_big_fil_WC_8_21_14_2_50_44_103]|nr:MAG: ABC transporter permease [Piscirickettsiaceae bacterium CG18_big_fil_WC_8_21_14_2_50_44_103]PIW76969.1 MAG: ABC transporter permease [Piscirickettsiaceae bacterium CG_4_8_14_3_um_filter_44_38]
MTFLNEFLTAQRWFFRALKRGDWLWLLLAILIASATVTFVETLGSTLKTSMLRQAANQLGADLVIRSSREIPPKWQILAEDLGLETAQSQSLTTMAGHKGQFQLVQLKAVSDNTPLRQPPDQQPLAFQSTPQDGAPVVWVESALMPLMNLANNSLIALGKTRFRFAGDFKAAGGFSGMGGFAYQMQISLNDLAATGLKGPGSRIQYELAVAGTAQALQQLSQQLNAENSPHLQVISAQAPSQDLAKSLDTAWLFLELAALSAVLVAGLSILIASRFYLQRWQNTIALMRAFGATQAQMSRLFGYQMTLLAILGSGLGVALGALLLQLSLPILHQYFEDLVLPDFRGAYLQGLLMGGLVLWSFAWQAFRQAVQTSPMQLLKNTVVVPKMQPWLISLGLILLLVIAITGAVTWVLLGLVIAAAVLYGASRLLIRFLQVWQTQSRGWLKLSLAALTKSPGLVKIQLISIGLVLFVLMVMTFVRQDLMQSWQSALPADTPDTFLINIQPDQKKAVETLLAQNNIKTQLVPMVRGRLVAVNGTPIQAQQQTQDRARRLLEREANIAVLDKPPAYNKMVEQAKMSDLTDAAQAMPRVSVEQGIADLFDLQLNDRLTFDLGGQQRHYRLDSIRQVEWQSLRLNFFFIIQPQADVSLPIAYISNFALKPLAIQANQLTQQLAQAAPGVLLIDAEKVLAQIQTIMTQASWGVSALYGFTLVASLIVLFTATLASQQSRVQSWMLLRTLGANHATLVKVGLSEFIILGALAGLLAATLAQLASLLISQWLLDMPVHFNPILWLTSLVVGVLILLTIGWLTQWRYLKHSSRQMVQKWS